MDAGDELEYQGSDVDIQRPGFQQPIRVPLDRLGDHTDSLPDSVSGGVTSSDDLQIVALSRAIDVERVFHSVTGGVFQYQCLVLPELDAVQLLV